MNLLAECACAGASSAGVVFRGREFQAGTDQVDHYAGAPSEHDGLVIAEDASQRLTTEWVRAWSLRSGTFAKEQSTEGIGRLRPERLPG
jgi:hypothetical protein